MDIELVSSTILMKTIPIHQTRPRKFTVLLKLKVSHLSTRKRQRKEPPQSTQEPDLKMSSLGSTESIGLLNLMFRSHLVIEFVERVNFIISHHEFGKSAILSTIMLLLGAKCNSATDHVDRADDGKLTLSVNPKKISKGQTLWSFMLQRHSLFFWVVNVHTRCRIPFCSSGAASRLFACGSLHGHDRALDTLVSPFSLIGDHIERKNMQTSAA